VTERVRRHALALADARGGDVVAEDLSELRVVEGLALDAPVRLAELVSRSRPRRAARAPDGSGRPAAGSLRLPHVQQPAREVDVILGEPEQHASPQPRVGEERQQEAIALRLPYEVPPPEIAAGGRGEEPLELGHVSTSGSASRFVGVRSGRAGSRSSCSSSTRKRKNDFNAAVARAWLEGAGRRFASSARKARRCVGRTSERSSKP